MADKRTITPEEKAILQAKHRHVQTFINMGVNLGLLPTKGLTLPLMSYGGSGILINCVGLAILLRVDYENRKIMRGGGRERT